jgi:hypothetical protein
LLHEGHHVGRERAPLQVGGREASDRCPAPGSGIGDGSVKGGVPGGARIDGYTVVIVRLGIEATRDGDGREGGAVTRKSSGSEGGGGRFRNEEESRELGLLCSQAVGELLLLKQQGINSRIRLHQEIVCFGDFGKLQIPCGHSPPINLLGGEGGFFGGSQLSEAGLALSQLCGQRSGDLGESGGGRGVAQGGQCGQGGFETGHLLADEFELIGGRVRGGASRSRAAGARVGLSRPRRGRLSFWAPTTSAHIGGGGGSRS